MLQPFYVCGLAAVLGCISAPAQQATAPSPATNASTEEALSDLKRGRVQQALDLLQQLIAANPKDASANLLAASAAVALYRPDLAVTYAERARALEPDNWKVDTTLVTAYAMAGKTRERDVERAKLREVHAAGKERDASQTTGFLLDLFRVKQCRVEAVEYFVPLGKFHIYYRFMLRNQQGQRIWQIAVESDDLNQASWARSYPEQAAQGQRQFQITGEGGGVRNDYRTFSGAPNYDWIKEHVIEIINAQAVPFPGEAAGTRD